MYFFPHFVYWDKRIFYLIIYSKETRMTENKGLYAMYNKDIQISVLSAKDFQAQLEAYFQSDT